MPPEEVALFVAYGVQLPHFKGQDGACGAMVASTCEIFFRGLARMK